MNKKSQIWVETVIYTLIAFVLIGAVLAFVKPKIEEIQDKAIIEQSIEILKGIDSLITEDIGSAAIGNQREVEVNIKKGVLKIDGVNDKLIFEIDSKYVYSQPGEEVSEGGLIVYTKKMGKMNFINLTKDYSQNYNITYDGEDILKTINPGATPYTLLISNKGRNENKIIIEFKLI